MFSETCPAHTAAWRAYHQLILVPNGVYRILRGILYDVRPAIRCTDFGAVVVGKNPSPLPLEAFGKADVIRFRKSVMVKIAALMEIRRVEIGDVITSGAVK